MANLIFLQKLNTAIYISITLVFVPFSTFIAYQIIKSHDIKSRELLFVAPTDNKSLIKRIFNTILIVVIALSFTWYLIDFGSVSFITEDLGAASALKKYNLILAGGLYAWLGWVVCYLTIFSFVWGCIWFFVIDWLTVLFKKQ